MAADDPRARAQFLRECLADVNGPDALTAADRFATAANASGINLAMESHTDDPGATVVMSIGDRAELMVVLGDTGAALFPADRGTVGQVDELRYPLFRDELSALADAIEATWT